MHISEENASSYSSRCVFAQVVRPPISRCCSHDLLFCQQLTISNTVITNVAKHTTNHVARVITLIVWEKDIHQRRHCYAIHLYSPF